jgi:hypothetical protein
MARSTMPTAGGPRGVAIDSAGQSDALCAHGAAAASDLAELLDAP